MTRLQHEAFLFRIRQEFWLCKLQFNVEKRQIIGTLKTLKYIMTGNFFVSGDIALYNKCILCVVLDMIDLFSLHASTLLKQMASVLRRTKNIYLPFKLCDIGFQLYSLYFVWI